MNNEQEKVSRKRWNKGLTVAGLFLLALAAVFVYRFRDLITWPHTYPAPPALASPSEEQVSWPYYGRDAGGARHSPLTEIHRNNVGQLKVAWTYHTGEAASPSPRNQCWSI